MRAILLLIIWLVFPSIAFSQAGTCKYKNRVCVDSVEPKKVDGVDVHFADVGIVDACWNWKETYTCVDEGVAIDYCAALDASGVCSANSSVCSQTSSVNGSCELYTKTYKCGNSLGAVPNVVTLADTYTLSQDSINYDACKSYSDNASCTLAQNICTDGPSTKVILGAGGTRAATGQEIASGVATDGVVKYEDCWDWKNTYTCLVGNYANYCQPLVASGCVESSAANCLNTGWNGTCLEFERTYQCGTPVQGSPTNVTYLNTSYSVKSDTELSTCSNLASNPNCTNTGTICTDGPATKVVFPNGSTRPATPSEVSSGISTDGAVITKSCWASDTTYSCLTSAQASSTCGSLTSNTACTEASSTCVDTLPNGDCGVKQHVFNCKTGPDKVDTEVDCGLQTFCIDGSCFDTGYTPDKDFGNSVAYMEAMREAVTYDVFKGTPLVCTNGVLNNCCNAKGGGENANDHIVSNTIVTTLFKLGAEEIYVWGSKFVFEALVNSGWAMLEEWAFAALTSGTLSTSGTITVWGAEFSVSTGAGVTFVGFDAFSFAIAALIYVLIDMAQCSVTEHQLALAKGQSLCHMVGSWCSNKVAGSCLATSEQWCCFPSKLGRIINEQGRPQIGKSWGSNMSPDCSGFTLDELGALRFDLMDFSEFINSIVVPVKNTTYAVDRLQQNSNTGNINSYYNAQ